MEINEKTIEKMVAEIINVKHEELLEFLNENLIISLNDKFNFVYRRFDDIDESIKRIDGTMKSIDGKTDVMPTMFKLLKTDMTATEKLTKRVDKLYAKKD